MKMYVVVQDYDNGMTYEDRDVAYGVFCGIFSTCDLAKKMIETLCSKEMARIRKWFEVEEDSPIQIRTEASYDPEVITETTMSFKTYEGFGYVKYSIVESEVDPEITVTRFS